jgi:hypothetical protein
VIAGIVGLVVVAVALFLVLGKSSGGSGSSPKDAAKTTLDAARAGNKTKILATLCAEDRALLKQPGTSIPTFGNDRLTSYTIGTVSQRDATHATVQTTTQTSGQSSPTNDEIPVLKTGGTWQVCFTSGLSGGLGGLGSGAAKGPAASDSAASSDPAGSASDSGGATDTSQPTDNPSDASTDGTSDYCGTEQDSAQDVAYAFAAAIDVGSSDLAQSCIYQGSVPASAIAPLLGTDFEPVDYSDDTSPISFSGGGRTISVTLTKEADGKYWVTGVQ